MTMSKKIELTPKQKCAVNSRNHTLLVSAAAGSGKTAVLTKRIIDLITDTDNLTDVSDILVVTFTKAAASELRERISKSLYEALQNAPDDKHLSKQLLMLGSAKICTIHSFCFDLIKKNFQLLGLPSNIRIADETETTLIMNNILNGLIEECYGGMHSDKIPHFEDFSENFLLGRTDDNLAVDFADIYNSLRNFTTGIDILKSSSDELEACSKTSVLNTKWGQVIKKYLYTKYKYYYSEFKNACEFFSSDDVFSVKYLPAFENDMKFCSEVLHFLDESSFVELVKLFSNVEFTSLKTVKSEFKTDQSIYYQKIRDSYKADVKKTHSEIFCFSEKSVIEHFKITSEINNSLYKFFCIFEKKYRHEKISRGLLDYNDLERMTLELLYSDVKSNTISNLAKNVQQKYKYIFIDEYQDVNELQDKIFSAISTELNRFMVGDIKQSIYGFRGSEPSLFAGYRKAFPEYKDDSNKSTGLTIFLSDNFRSNKTILDFSNSVFDILFNNNSGNMPYTREDRLVCSKKYGIGEKDHEVRLCFMENEDKTDRCIREAEFVADEVQKLILNGTDPSDIALLFRSKKKTIFYEDALRKRNISSFNQVDRGFFENDAVLLMLCLLNAVDNPSRDIYLAGLMKSPIFDFSLNEITLIRINQKEGTLYDAVKKYAEIQDSQKCKEFLDKLNEWRKYAEGCPVNKFVRYIYDQTHIVELLSGKIDSDADIERHANLLLLYEYAMKFENGSFKGLYNFILYLNDIIEKNTQLGNARTTSEGKGVVNIMSIHNSKGLEFDTVFLCDTGASFNKNDERKNYILTKELGLTLKLRDRTSFGRIDAFPRVASKYLIQENALDEEMRVLYVALTRAVRRLVVTSSIKDPREKIESISSSINKVCHHVLLETKNVSELILWGILKSDYTDYSLEFITENTPINKENSTEIQEKQYDESLIEKYKKIINERLSFVYPNIELTKMPAKLSVSKLYPGVLDDYATEVNTSAPSMYVKPKFLLSEEKRATGTDRGTATHVFMQFCDFNNVQNRGVENELSRLVEKGFIDRKTAELVNINKVKLFFDDELYFSLIKAKKIWREKRFTIKLPATEFVTQKTELNLIKNEQVLVQGVIDLLFENDEGKLILADYKTDWFSNDEIESGNAEKILIERHTMQLNYYAQACEKMLKRKVDQIYIYSFSLGKAIRID